MIDRDFVSKPKSGIRVPDEPKLMTIQKTLNGSELLSKDMER